MSTPRLFFTASVEEQWQTLAGPWLRELAGTAWKNPKPTAILTPSRAESFYLRSRLVAEGVPYFGLRFWTPSDARKFLLAETSPGIQSATLAEQRLIVRACAEELSSRASVDKPTLASVVREPGAFLRAYDLLLAAGWDPAREGAAYGRDLAQEFQREVNARGIATQAGLHRHLLRKIASAGESLIANLLVVGFNATHWPLWDLLKAAVFSTEQAAVALLSPREFGGEIDKLWHSSWEELTQTEAIHPFSLTASASIEEPDAPFADLVGSYERGNASAPSMRPTSPFSPRPTWPRRFAPSRCKPSIICGATDCTRLGIAFPEANALALGVADELRRLEIPLDDGTGAWTPGIFEQRSWQSWIALQEEPGVQRLIAWLRACDAQRVSCGLKSGLSAREAADILESALGDTLVDNLDFLARHIEAHSNRRGAADVAKFLRPTHRLAGRSDFRRLSGAHTSGLRVARLGAAPRAFANRSSRLAPRARRPPLAPHVPRVAQGIDRLAGPHAGRRRQSLLRESPPPHLRPDDRPDLESPHPHRP